ncbi:putative leader peptide [Streptomyces fulvorobeus]
METSDRAPRSLPLLTRRRHIDLARTAGALCSRPLLTP